MASFALTPRVAGLILAVCVITTFPSHAFAQGPNPLIGVWTLNLAKSTFSPVAAQEQAPLTFGPWNQGVQALTAATWSEAVECGKEHYSGCGMGVLGVLCDLSSIHVYAITPFGRVALTVRGDLQDLRTPKPPTFAAANAGGVVVNVNPVSTFSLIQSVTRAVIERDGTRIEPLAVTLTPQVYQNGFGASKTANDGEFKFPRSAFALGARVRLMMVFAGDGPLACDISDATLRSLR